jgi:hypothetical protein
MEAIPSHRLGDVDVEETSRWVTNAYPQMQYPAAFVGSSSGALVHLAAALRLPWLPQTFLIGVRRPAMSPDEPKEDMEWGRENARPLLEANPDIQLHHMHDPNQDRLMIQYMTYFRYKRLKLGEAYESFLRNNLQPGGTIFTVECLRRWSTTRIGARHYFQFGALGGATPEEFLHGSERVAAYLERYKSDRRKWDAPTPDSDDMPEAEWGFEPTLLEDIERFALRNGFKVRRILFDEPEHLSPLTADLYRWWYRQRGLTPNRLFVQSFMITEPWWTLRTGSAPFWLKFNMEPSAEWLETYLDGTDPYDYIYLTLMSHGVECVGLAPIERWRALLSRARKEGRFLGVDEEKFPRHFGVFGSYYRDLQSVPARYPMPGALSIGQLEQFLAEAGGRYPVEIREHEPDYAMQPT